MGLKEARRGYWGLQRVTRGLSGLQGVTEGLQKKFLFFLARTSKDTFSSYILTKAKD